MGWNRLRCLDRRRSASGAAHPAGSADPRANRALPHRAIANRRGTRASGCSGRANTLMNRRKTSWKRRCASCGGRTGTGGCSPMMSFSSGTRSTMSRPFGPNASTKGVAPDAQLCFALTQKRTDKALKRLRQSGIRDVALVLVELAGGKKAARRNKRLVQLIDDGGLADTGISGNEHQLRRCRWPRRGRRRRAGYRSRGARPYSFSGISSRSGVSCSPSGNSSMRPEFPTRQGSAEDRSRRRPRSGSAPRQSWRAAS